MSHPTHRPLRGALLALGTALLVACTGIAPREDTVRADPAHAALDQGRAHYAAGRYGLAIDSLERELARYPTSLAAMNGLGACYDELGRHDVARRYYMQALAIAPDAPKTLGNLGRSFLADGRPADAVAVLTLAAAAAPDDRWIADTLARARAALPPPTTAPVARDAVVAKAPIPAAPIPAAPIPAAPIPAAPIQVAPVVVVAAEPMTVAPAPKAPAPAIIAPAPKAAEPAVVAPTPKASAPVVVAPAPKAAAPVIAPAPIVAPVETAAPAPAPVIAAAPLTDPPASTPSTPSSGTVSAPSRLEVSNGNGVEGLARAVSAWLASERWVVSRVTNATTYGHAVTEVRHAPGRRPDAEALAARLPVACRIAEGQLRYAGTELRLVLGADLISHLALGLDGPVLAWLGPRDAIASAARVEVSNGNGVPGLARRVGTSLRADGATVARITNATTFDQPETVVLHRPDAVAAAERLAAWLPLERVKLVPTRSLSPRVDVRIVLGRDLADVGVRDAALAAAR